MKVHIWFRDPRLVAVMSKDSVMVVDLPTIPAKRESIVFTLCDNARADKEEINVHMKVSRRMWRLIQDPQTRTVEVEAHVYCVDRLEDE